MLITYNKGLNYLLDQPNLNTRQARWLAFLSEYDFEIQHIKEKENKVVDDLSRNARLNFMAAINTYKIDLEYQLEEGVKLDENYFKLQAKVGENVTGSLKTSYSLNEKRLILYKNRQYIPKVKLLILNEIHKSPYSGHPDYQKTITMLQKDYFWQNMKNELEEYIARCFES